MSEYATENMYIRSLLQMCPLTWQQVVIITVAIRAGGAVWAAGPLPVPGW